MHFTNHDLFNNGFLNSIKIQPSRLEESLSFLRSIKDWYNQADFSSTETLVRTFIRPALQNQSLDILPIARDPCAFFLSSPWDRDEILGLIYLIPPNEHLYDFNYDEKLLKGNHWSIKAINIALQHECKWIILTNGYQWRLMNSQILHRYESYFELDLGQVVLSKENDREFQLSIYLFAMLFGLDYAFGKDEQTGQQFLNDFYQDSMYYSQKIERYLKQVVTDDLGTSAGGDGIMAQLCYGFVRAIESNGNRGFTEEERNGIFRDATYLLYRLLFLFYAEARGLLPIEHELYQKASLESLVTLAIDILASSSVYNYDGMELWRNLDHLFKLVDNGDIPLRIPAFDGGLFDNSGHDYLGHAQISNFYMAQALVQLAYQHDVNGEIIELIDYRDLSVRHLGSLYEGMIEYRLYIAEEELLARRKTDGTVQYLLASKTKKKDDDESLPQGSIYFAQNSRERKATGTHYTPEDLVGKLVTQTVLKELEHRWQMFTPDFSAMLNEYATLTDDHKREAFQHYIDHQLIEFVGQQILSLKVCDPAMGSGHFLVYTAHTITNFILWVLSQTVWNNPDIELTPLFWRRNVVEQCLYGVDINPTAVELAKLSLWLSTLQSDYPLSFLDHRLKTGNSLLGVYFEEIKNILDDSALNRKSTASKIAEATGQYAFSEPSNIEKAAKEAVAAIRHILSLHSDNIEAVKAQKEDFRTAQEILQSYGQVGDFLVALKMGLKVDYTIQHKIARLLEQGRSSNDSRINSILDDKESILDEYHPFHWSLEYPDIFLTQENKGFDVIIGNPPYLGGYKIKGDLGKNCAKFLRNQYPSARGQVDLSAYFLLMNSEILKLSGSIGLVVTNTISQGDTRRAALAYLLEQGFLIYFAEKFIPWGGYATVEVNLISLMKSEIYRPNIVLDNSASEFISSWLDDLPEQEPTKLRCNMNKAFIGDAPRGIGFILSKQEAELLLQDKRNRDCVLPYLTGQDLNTSPNQVASRYIICFQDWSKERAESYTEPFRIVEEKVKPQRMKVAEKNERDHWWQFARFRKELRNSIGEKEVSLARSSISERHALSFVTNNQVNSKQLVIFTYDDWFSFSVLQSFVHEVWLRRQASSMRTDVCYTPTDCFQTFPFPHDVENLILEKAGDFGKRFYDYRQQVMLTRQLGLTKTYNLIHDPECQDDDIVHLRALQVDMDESVLACYGWEDIDLDHNFYKNDRKKIRYMPSAVAQREIFTRLLSLNQRIAEEELMSNV